MDVHDIGVKIAPPPFYRLYDATGLKPPPPVIPSSDTEVIVFGRPLVMSATHTACGDPTITGPGVISRPDLAATAIPDTTIEYVYCHAYVCLLPMGNMLFIHSRICPHLFPYSSSLPCILPEL